MGELGSAGGVGGARRAAERLLARGALAALALLIAVPAAGAGIQGAAGAPLRGEREQERLLAGHLLRRLGFGPNRREMHEVLRVGRAAYLEQQLRPDAMDDRLGVRRFHPEPGPRDDGLGWQLRWLTRMAYSRRQLQEKMTLLWHEHFATSYNKIGSYVLMHDQEELFRAHALGSFRDLLVAVTTDNAMLFYLDNSNNDGQARNGGGEKIPPNENYARELLQLFALGVNQLDMDGTHVLDRGGKPVPAYSEADVKEVARALTGWVANSAMSDPEDPTEVIPPAVFVDSQHDPDAKTVLGVTIPADAATGARDVERVVDILMQQRTMAPFIAKELILKLATEAPSPGYVARVAAVFASTRGDIRAVLRALFTDPEFTSAAVLRSQYKVPIEHVMGMVRGLDATGGARSLYYWTYLTGHLVYFPPSVFSFYRPGQKGALVSAAYVAMRDQAADSLTSGYVDEYFDIFWDAGAMIRRHRLQRRPDTAVDLLARDLLAAPVAPSTRRVLLDHIGPRVTEEKLRGAAWLLMCAPDYQVN
ncbi:MAG: DUF1800 family protein [Candidatus Binatia bacterium]